MIVLDASVVIKWFQEEPDSEKALDFEKKHVRGEDTIAIPDLLFYEFTNVLRYKKNVTQENAFAALGILAGMELQVFTFSPAELKDVYSFARSYDTSVYDALYMILAERLNCRFITADKKLHQKLKAHSRVMLL